MQREQVWVGIDAGADLAAVCALDERGRVLREEELAASSESICKHLAKLGPPAKILIGIEAGSTSIHLTRGLRAAGYKVRILETYATSGFLQVRQNKTDRNDARGIADVVRLGADAVPEVMLKSVDGQRLRSELVLRDRLMKQRGGIENALRAVLRINGRRIGRVYSGTHLERVVRVELDGLRDQGSDISAFLEPALLLATEVRRVLERATRQLERVAKENEVCSRLMTVPGVGCICALSFYTAVEDPWRFKHNEDVGPYFGLVPKLSQSGQISRSGRITKRGNRMTRTHLVTAAKSMIQQQTIQCALRRWALAVRERGGTSKAQVALARKLAIVMLSMWKSGQIFQPEQCFRV